MLFPVIAIAGLPRVGSMWTFNVVRNLVTEAGFSLAPAQVPKKESVMIAAAESYLGTVPARTWCVIKVHSLLDPTSDVKVIRNKRDPRDRLFSFCQFTNMSFDEESIIQMVAKNLEVESHYDQWPDTSILNVSFDSIESDGIGTIRRISDFVGLPVPSAEILEEINFRLSKQQVKKRIARLNDLVFDDQGAVRLNTDQSAVVETGPGTVRAFDVGSGFQSSHVSDYRSGDWKKMWTDEQKRMVDKAFQVVQQRNQAQL